MSGDSASDFLGMIKLGIHMHVYVCVCGYGKYQNPKINREAIFIYGCVCIYAWYSNTLKSYAARRMAYPQTRIWIPIFKLVYDFSVFEYLCAYRAFVC